MYGGYTLLGIALPSLSTAFDLTLYAQTRAVGVGIRSRGSADCLPHVENTQQSANAWDSLLIRIKICICPSFPYSSSESYSATYQLRDRGKEAGTANGGLG